MQIKTRIRYHLIVAIINKSTNNKCWWGCGERGNPFALLVGMQTWAATGEGSTEIPQKIKNGSPFWLSNPTSEHVSERTQNSNSKEHKYPYVHCSVIYNHQDMDAAQVSISRRVDKTTMGCLQNATLLGRIKEDNFTLWDSMDGSGEHYAMWNKPVRARQISSGIIHMWHLMNKLN